MTVINGFEVAQRIGLSPDLLSESWVVELVTTYLAGGRASELPVYDGAWRRIAQVLSEASEVREAFVSVVLLDDYKDRRLSLAYLFNLDGVQEEIRQQTSREFCPGSGESPGRSGLGTPHTEAAYCPVCGRGFDAVPFDNFVGKLPAHWPAPIKAPCTAEAYRRRRG